MDLLRKSGAASAAKKASREAREGVIAQFIAPGGKSGVLVEVNCETDFVARNEAFRAFADEIAKKIAADPQANLDADREAAVGKMGENIKIARHARLDVSGNGLVAAYIHTGAKVGVLVEVGAGKAETVAKRRIQATRQGHHAANRGGHPARGFPRASRAGSHRQGTRNCRAIRPFERQARRRDGKNPGRACWTNSSRPTASWTRVL